MRGVCDGPMQEGGTGAWYCPVSPWNDEYDCERCNEERERDEERTDDMKREEGETWG